MRALRARAARPPGACRDDRWSRRSRTTWTWPWPTRTSRLRWPSTTAGTSSTAIPSLWTGEAIFGVLSLVTRDFAPLADRLEPRPAAARGDSRRSSAGCAKIVQEAPLDWKGRARRECQAAVTLFDATLPAWVETEVPAAGAAWTVASRRAARAFEAFDAWLGPVGQPTLLAAFRSSMPTRRRSASRPAATCWPCCWPAATSSPRRSTTCCARRPTRSTKPRHASTRCRGRTAAGRRCRSCWPAITPRPTSTSPASSGSGAPARRPPTRTTWSPGPTRRSATCRSRRTPARPRPISTTCTTARRRRSIPSAPSSTSSRRSMACRPRRSRPGCAG